MLRQARPSGGRDEDLDPAVQLPDGGVVLAVDFVRRMATRRASAFRMVFAIGNLVARTVNFIAVLHELITWITDVWP